RPHSSPPRRSSDLIWGRSALRSWLAKGSRRPAALTRALSRGMAENPRRRPADVEAWLASIEEALAEPPADPPAEASAPAAHAETAEAGAAPARPRRRARMALAAVLRVVGFAAGLGRGAGVWHDPPVDAAADAPLAETGVGSLPDGPDEHAGCAGAMPSTSAGRAWLVLRARTADGTVLETHHRVRVEESELLRIRCNRSAFRDVSWGTADP